MNVIEEATQTYEDAFILIKSNNRKDILLGIANMRALLATNPEYNFDNIVYNMAYGYYRLGASKQLYALFKLFHDPNIFKLIERDQILKYKASQSTGGCQEFLQIVSSCLILISLGSFIANRL